MAETTTTTTTAVSKLSLNYDYKFEVDTTPTASTPTYAQIDDGFDNVSKAINEVIYQASYFGDSGYGSTEVTGGQMTVSLSGVRKFGDTAQDFIFSDAVMNNFGSARKSNFRITDPVGDVISGSCTFAKITESGGSANGANAISVDIHINGKPTYTAASSS